MFDTKNFKELNDKESASMNNFLKRGRRTILFTGRRRGKRRIVRKIGETDERQRES